MQLIAAGSIETPPEFCDVNLDTTSRIIKSQSLNIFMFRVLIIRRGTLEHFHYMDGLLIRSILDLMPATGAIRHNYRL